MTQQIIEKRRVGGVDMAKIRGEAEMLASLEHPHTVRLKQVASVITSRCMSRGTSCTSRWRSWRAAHLKNFCASCGRRVSIHTTLLGQRLRERDASEIVKGILEAVAYLHALDIAHRDLKPGRLSLRNCRKRHVRETIGSRLTKNRGLRPQRPLRPSRRPSTHR